jgi:hypothetical protein
MGLWEERAVLVAMEVLVVLAGLVMAVPELLVVPEGWEESAVLLPAEVWLVRTLELFLMRMR